MSERPVRRSQRQKPTSISSNTRWMKRSRVRGSRIRSGRENENVKMHNFIKCKGCCYEHYCLVHGICFHCGHEEPPPKSKRPQEKKNKESSYMEPDLNYQCWICPKCFTDHRDDGPCPPPGLNDTELAGRCKLQGHRTQRTGDWDSCELCRAAWQWKNTPS